MQALIGRDWGIIDKLNYLIRSVCICIWSFIQSKTATTSMGKGRQEFLCMLVSIKARDFPPSFFAQAPGSLTPSPQPSKVISWARAVNQSLAVGSLLSAMC